MKPLALLATLFCAVAPCVSAEDQLAGYDRLTVSASHRPSLVAASIWYPVGTPTYQGLIGDNPVFKGIYAYVGAAPQPGKHPLVLLSHGSGGNMDGLSWLSSDLAKHGAIVVAVNHPGSTSGDSSPRRSVLLEDRARDLSAALDTVLKDQTWAPLIDQSRIVSFGFSLGGTTSLGIAGIRFDRKAYKAYCDRFQERATDCLFFAKGGVDFDHLPEQWEADMHDARVSKVIAVDPGASYAVKPESIAAAKMPILLINLGDRDRMAAVDVGPNGSNLSGHLADVTYEVFGPANHFTFLGICKQGAARLLAETRDDPVCDDPAYTDRAAIHRQVINATLKFLQL